jgi:hypothetical protein
MRYVNSSGQISGCEIRDSRKADTEDPSLLKRFFKLGHTKFLPHFSIRYRLVVIILAAADVIK